MIVRGYLLEASIFTLALALGSFATGCGSDPSTTTSNTTGSGTGASGSGGGGQSSSGTAGGGQGGGGTAGGGQGGGGTAGGGQGGGQGGSGGAGQGGSGGQGGAGGEPCVPQTEVCDGADNNCDGQVDEGCICMPGKMQACYSGPTGTEGVGACKAGAQTCDGMGQWGSCTGEVLPENESCDGKDNNCDGTTDDGNPGGNLACMTGLPGPCATGTTACSNGSVMCIQNVQPSPEMCDGMDNNCNGATDEGNPGGNMACMTGLPGPCAAGKTTCTNGSVMCIQTVQPSPEACDNVDNNCNGTTDEGNPGGNMTCLTGLPGLCAAGKTACTNGSIQCIQTVQPSPEMCDGLDNDCNGAIDEGNPGGNMPCMTGLPGPCATGTSACAGGIIVCNQDVQPTLEVCDGADNNCDGTTDEVNSTGSTGTCDHNKCVEGTLLDSACDSCVGVICAVDSYCCTNSWDSLCVGEVLSECNVQCTGSCDTGQIGPCATGSEVCASGTLGCVQDVFPSMEVCDAEDNDCNGLVDDNIPGIGMSCMTGIPGLCAAGITECNAGMFACTPVTPLSADVCGDGLDNNCDGAIDPFCSCAHTGCVTGSVLTSGCDACVTQICGVDPYCCNNSWDGLCVSEVSSVCGLVCP